MQNDMRDRLIGLISSAGYDYDDFIEESHERGLSVTEDFEEWCADYLIANGVVLPPCKVGQTVYVISRYYAGDWEAYKCEIDSITIYEKNTFISCVANDVRFGKINFGLNVSEIGKTVFLTKEQAEQKLKELSENG